MSKYRVIRTEFKTPESLIKALDDLKLDYQKAANLRENSLTVQTHWRSFGGTNQPAAVVMTKQDLLKAGVSSMDELGFSWNGSGYDLIQDHYDETKPGMIAMMNKLRQRYAFHEVQRLARAKGYTVRETATDGSGQIRVVFAKR